MAYMVGDSVSAASIGGNATLVAGTGKLDASRAARPCRFELCSSA
jgi:hypothetical protein